VKRRQRFLVEELVVDVEAANRSRQQLECAAGLRLASSA